MDTSSAATGRQALAGLWQQAGLPPAALAQAALNDAGPVLPTSFAVAAAAQGSLAAAALAAAEIGHRRAPAAPRQQVSVDAVAAAVECGASLAIDGRPVDAWDKLSGLYRCGEDTGVPGWLRLHANFAHHRDGALHLLGLPEGPATERDAVTQALRGWRAEDFEAAASEAGLVVAAARSFSDWDAHPQGRALAGAAPFTLARLPGAAAPRPWPARGDDARPLAGLRVLELTRILAGPVAGRTLAGYGAEVLLLNSPLLPNIEHIADTSRGKLSAHVDLKTEAGRATLQAVLPQADVFLQGYRPGGLAALGFAPSDVARASPGIVCVSLSAYGPAGPWAGRRGFDSLVQTATGFNHAEAAALGSATPKALPVQILDFAAGYLLAFAAQAALLRQRLEGGSWHVQVSLAAVGLWLRGLGRVAPAAGSPDAAPCLQDWPSGWGRLRSPGHAAHFSDTPAAWLRPAMPPGTHAAAWP
ncbi:MAG: CoA transferase [Rubrivivax sp.]|nr:CoA transferase [Rubrivivax sp.]